ncbi:MurR/RpiR family transcriptional regulator [Szabonella alba]|uniref:MurR/RpiR family transcriptional regulator n=1 Tax=Szabonella alba TaxID=2804194 RepID=A0A8K0VAB9_9RHOB|nr:MurR/RpiR family transcriptional regulator [Szabonella alba]MBL4916543.1 MurR/RpiR family transcriptional regulator [Szabonella alba]
MDAERRSDPAPMDAPPDRRIPDIVGRIKDVFATLSPAERRVAAAVLSDVRQAVEDSSAALAVRARVSEPSVTRFCRTIGCDGVRDFKLKLAQSLVVGELYLYADTAPSASDATDQHAPEFWGVVLGDAHAALREVERQINPDAVLAAAADIARAGQVVTFGLGGSAAPLALETQHRLFRYGVRAVCCTDPYLMRMTAATLHANDVVIAISASGKTAELIEAVELARGYGATTIAITAMASPLIRSVQHPLGVAIPENTNTLTPTAARFAYLAVIDLLSAATGYALGPSARESLRRIKYAVLNHRNGNILEPLGD